MLSGSMMVNAVAFDSWCQTLIIFAFKRPRRSPFRLYNRQWLIVPSSLMPALAVIQIFVESGEDSHCKPPLLVRLHTWTSHCVFSRVITITLVIVTLRKLYTVLCSPFDIKASANRRIIPHFKVEFHRHIKNLVHINCHTINYSYSSCKKDFGHNMASYSHNTRK